MVTATAKPGDVLEDKVELVRALGHGGMGMVFEGLHRRTGRRVAVKVLRSEIATDAQVCSRFLQEALACGRIQHPNVVDVLDASVAGGHPYIVMELLEGETLAARIGRDGPLPIADTLDLFAQVLGGVGAAHANGIVHRDIKPDNIFLARSASVRRPPRPGRPRSRPRWQPRSQSWTLPYGSHRSEPSLCHGFVSSVRVDRALVVELEPAFRGAQTSLRARSSSQSSYTISGGRMISGRCSTRA